MALIALGTIGATGIANLENTRKPDSLGSSESFGSSEGPEDFDGSGIPARPESFERSQGLGSCESFAGSEGFESFEIFDSSESFECFEGLRTLRVLKALELGDLWGL